MSVTSVDKKLLFGPSYGVHDIATKPQATVQVYRFGLSGFVSRNWLNRVTANGWYIGQPEQLTAGTVARHTRGVLSARHRFESAFESTLRFLARHWFKSIRRPRHCLFWIRISRKSKDCKPFKKLSWYKPTNVAVKPETVSQREVVRASSASSYCQLGGCWFVVQCPIEDFFVFISYQAPFLWFSRESNSSKPVK